MLESGQKNNTVLRIPPDTSRLRYVSEEMCETIGATDAVGNKRFCDIFVTEVRHHIPARRDVFREFGMDSCMVGAG
jgi:hypothetical protein